MSWEPSDEGKVAALPHRGTLVDLGVWVPAAGAMQSWYRTFEGLGLPSRGSS